MTYFELDKTSSRESAQANREYNAALAERLLGTEVVGSDVVVTHYDEGASLQDQIPHTD